MRTGLVAGPRGAGLPQNRQMAFSAAFYLAASQPSADFALVSLLSLRVELLGEAKAEDAVADIRRVVVPGGDTTAPGVAVPAAATVHAERAR